MPRSQCRAPAAPLSLFFSAAGVPLLPLSPSVRVAFLSPGSLLSWPCRLSAPLCLASMALPWSFPSRALSSAFSVFPWHALLCCCLPEFAHGLCRSCVPRSRATRPARVFSMASSLLASWFPSWSALVQVISARSAAVSSRLFAARVAFFYCAHENSLLTTACQVFVSSSSRACWSSSPSRFLAVVVFLSYPGHVCSCQVCLLP
jgi:hypothetical protein